MLPKLLNSSSDNFFVLAGPCVIEGEEIVMQIAERLVTICSTYDIPLVFKGSYKKANRTRIDSFTGIGNEAALAILAKVRATFNIPVVTDIHTEEEAELAAKYVDVLQIPAFLCSSPASMQFAVDKIVQSGNDQVMLTDRGTMFGYQDLVVDYRSIPIMQSFKVPVIMDCTHSLQQPNQTSGVTGGNPQMISTIAKAAIAVGADGLFIETHPDPANAKSDGANMLHLDEFEQLMKQLVAIRKAIR
ncbi:MAG: 3-deoxy-8-phosphooctulonate synthase [Chitinophagia bacterium]|nr:3-deoxy-8-phosphooctulonate synthase [Chitinophagia bacterium]